VPSLLPATQHTSTHACIQPRQHGSIPAPYRLLQALRLGGPSALPSDISSTSPWRHRGYLPCGGCRYLQRCIFWLPCAAPTWAFGNFRGAYSFRTDAHARKHYCLTRLFAGSMLAPSLPVCACRDAARASARTGYMTHAFTPACALRRTTACTGLRRAQGGHGRVALRTWR